MVGCREGLRLIGILQSITACRDLVCLSTLDLALLSIGQNIGTQHQSLESLSPEDAVSSLRVGASLQSARVGSVRHLSLGRVTSKTGETGETLMYYSLQPDLQSGLERESVSSCGVMWASINQTN